MRGERRARPGLAGGLRPSTLYFETDAEDGLREPGFSKERRLVPQITIGLLTHASGFPLMVEALEGNRGTTMLPTIQAFVAHLVHREARHAVARTSSA